MQCNNRARRNPLRRSSDMKLRCWIEFVAAITPIFAVMSVDGQSYCAYGQLEHRAIIETTTMRTPTLFTQNA